MILVQDRSTLSLCYGGKVYLVPRQQQDLAMFLAGHFELIRVRKWSAEGAEDVQVLQTRVALCHCHVGEAPSDNIIFHWQRRAYRAPPNGRWQNSVLLLPDGTILRVWGWPKDGQPDLTEVDKIGSFAVVKLAA